METTQNQPSEAESENNDCLSIARSEEEFTKMSSEVETIRNGCLSVVPVSEKNESKSSFIQSDKNNTSSMHILHDGNHSYATDPTSSVTQSDQKDNSSTGVENTIGEHQSSATESESALPVTRSDINETSSPLESTQDGHQLSPPKSESNPPVASLDRKDLISTLAWDGKPSAIMSWENDSISHEKKNDFSPPVVNIQDGHLESESTQSVPLSNREGTNFHVVQEGHHSTPTVSEKNDSASPIPQSVMNETSSPVVVTQDRDQSSSNRTESTPSETKSDRKDLSSTVVQDGNSIPIGSEKNDSTSSITQSNMNVSSSPITNSQGGDQLSNTPVASVDTSFAVAQNGNHSATKLEKNESTSSETLSHEKDSSSPANTQGSHQLLIPESEYNPRVALMDMNDPSFTVVQDGKANESWKNDSSSSETPSDMKNSSSQVVNNTHDEHLDSESIQSRPLLDRQDTSPPVVQDGHQSKPTRAEKNDSILSITQSNMDESSSSVTNGQGGDQSFVTEAESTKPATLSDSQNPSSPVVQDGHNSTPVVNTLDGHQLSIPQSESNPRIALMDKKDPSSTVVQDVQLSATESGKNDSTSYEIPSVKKDSSSPVVNTQDGHHSTQSIQLSDRQDTSFPVVQDGYHPIPTMSEKNDCISLIPQPNMDESSSPVTNSQDGDQSSVTEAESTQSVSRSDSQDPSSSVVQDGHQSTPTGSDKKDFTSIETQSLKIDFSPLIVNTQDGNQLSNPLVASVDRKDTSSTVAQNGNHSATKLEMNESTSSETQYHKKDSGSPVVNTQDGQQLSTPELECNPPVASLDTSTVAQDEKSSATESGKKDSTSSETLPGKKDSTSPVVNIQDGHLGSESTQPVPLSNREGNSFPVVQDGHHSTPAGSENVPQPVMNETCLPLVDTQDRDQSSSNCTESTPSQTELDRKDPSSMKTPNENHSATESCETLSDKKDSSSSVVKMQDGHQLSRPELERNLTVVSMDKKDPSSTVVQDVKPSATESERNDSTSSETLPGKKDSTSPVVNTQDGHLGSESTQSVPLSNNGIPAVQDGHHSKPTGSVMNDFTSSETQSNEKDLNSPVVDCQDRDQSSSNWTESTPSETRSDRKHLCSTVAQDENHSTTETWKNDSTSSETKSHKNGPSVPVVSTQDGDQSPETETGSTQSITPLDRKIVNSTVVQDLHHTSEDKSMKNDSRTLEKQSHKKDIETFSDTAIAIPKGEHLLQGNRHSAYDMNAGIAPFRPCGLANLGSTCYMNAALQAFGSVVPLKDYLMNGMTLCSDVINDYML